MDSSSKLRMNEKGSSAPSFRFGKEHASTPKHAKSVQTPRICHQTVRNICTKIVHMENYARLLGAPGLIPSIRR
jgi:hypothetical protein